MTPAYAAARFTIPSFLPDPNFGDDLLQRMRQTQRVDSPVFWHPVVKTVSPTLQPFTCPDHDFAIPMHGSDYRICRICGHTDSNFFEPELMTSLLLAKLWPISQMSDEIYHQFRSSGLHDPTIANNVQSLADRAFNILYHREHPLRTCECYHCEVDLRAIEDRVLPGLNHNLRAAIHLGRSMHEQIEDAVNEASRQAMLITAQQYGLSEQHTQALADHITQCGTDLEDVHPASSIEQTISAAAYSIANGDDPQKPQGQHWLSRTAWLYEHIDVPEHQEAVAATAGPVARDLADQITTAWVTQFQSSFPQHATIPDSRAPFIWASNINAAISIFEFMRHQATGISTGQQSWPPPHHHCVDEIATTAHWAPRPPEPFQEGRGYQPDHDYYRHQQREA